MLADVLVTPLGPIPGDVFGDASVGVSRLSFLERARGEGVADMRTQAIVQWIAIGCMLAITGCSKAPVTAPQTAPPAPTPTTLEFDVRFTYADSGYTVRDVEYADPSGVVHKVDYQPPDWNTTMTFMPGERLYFHVEVEYRSGLLGMLQITGPNFSRSDRLEHLSGPGTTVLQIDEQLK
jgi:hypothetical protein